MQVTVLETIQRGGEFLARKGIDSPRLQAELLLAHLLKVPRMRLYLDFERVLTPAETEGIRDLMKRRGRREPLQHIVGSTSFCGLEILVNQHVLVPRPETELLAEAGWEYLNHRVASKSSAPASEMPVALDYGTGSGCLGIALAVKCPACRIEAVDISAEAVGVARRNAELHGLANRIGFWHGDGFAAFPRLLKFDLIISNPPYIPTRDIDSLDPEVRDFDPREALDGGPDGLRHYRNLATRAGDWLHPQGKLMLELGDGLAEAVGKLLQEQNWVVERITEDYTHRPRIMIAHPGAQAPVPSPDARQEPCPI